MPNKVRFGLKNVHYAGMTVASNGTVSFDTPVAIPGAVNLSLSKTGETAEFYADDGVYFEIGDNMKYDEEKKQADIEQYGLYTYEDFADYVTEEQFIAFNGPYLKVLVGKGVLTYEEILNLIDIYVNPAE